MEAVTDFTFFGSKITADGDYSHEITGRLLIGREAMTSFIFLGSKMTVDGDCAMKLKEPYFWKESCDKPQFSSVQSLSCV